MKALSALALVLLLAGLVVTVGVITYATATATSPATQEAIRAAAAQDLAERQASAARWAVWWDAVTPLGWLVLAVLALCVVIGAPAALGIALAAQWDRRRKLANVYAPDARGLLPVSPGALDQAAVMGLAGHHQASIEAARRPAFSGSARNERLTITQGTAPAALPNRPAVELPSPAAPLALPGPVGLAQVLTWQPDLNRVLIGLDPTGHPLTVSARELCHVALVGATGGGKSNAMRLLLGQLLAAGARAILIDPHYAPLDPDDPTTGDWRPIEHRLYRPPAVLPSEMSAAFDWLSEELTDRLARRRHGERSGPPLFVAIDELPSIVAHVDQAPEVLTRVVREGRKVGLLAITSSQDFLVKSIGTGSAARDNFRTAIYAGGDTTSARVLLDVPAKAIPEGELGRGVVMLRSQATPTAGLARLPLVTDQDLVRLLPAPPGVASAPPPSRRPSLVDLAYPAAARPPLTVLPGGAPSGALGGASTGVAPDDGEDGEDEAQPPSAPVYAPPPTPPDPDAARRERVRELAGQGLSRNSICAIIFGSKNKANMDYIRDALGEADQAADGD